MRCRFGERRRGRRPVDLVTFERTGSIGTCTINRPDKLNALSHAVVYQLQGLLREVAEDDETKVLMLRGAGASFSAGYDLTEEADGENACSWHETLSRDVAMTMELWAFPKPTMAVVRGWCLAGGCELAMACDLVVAADDARFGEPEIRYGSGPVTLLMPFVIGQKKTNELLFTGDTVDAVEAQRLGFVNRVVSGEQLETEARRLAERIALAPLPVLKMTKLSLVRAFQAAGLNEAVAHNLDLSAILNAAESPEQREFDRIVASEGLKRALGWRDERYGSGLGES
ncbi:MAG: enoyl-CoA hydratase/isomerase family protein [Acidimicrobiales bacterium]